MIKVIEWVLSNFPETRDSDKELMIRILDYKDAKLSDRQREIIRGLNFESIRRTRQKIQEAGRFLPSKRISRGRKLKGMIVQQNIPKTKPENVQNLLEQRSILDWGE